MTTSNFNDYFLNRSDQIKSDVNTILSIYNKEIFKGKKMAWAYLFTPFVIKPLKSSDATECTQKSNNSSNELHLHAI